MGTMASTEYGLPHWVVLDGPDDEPRKRFCCGHADEATTQNDAEGRTARAKGLGISATYSVVPNPA